MRMSIQWVIVAIALLSISHAQVPSSMPAGDASAAERLTRKGLALGDHSAAEFNYYVQALQANPRYAPARIHLGAWLRAHHRDDEALRQYLAALSADPSYIIGHFALAEFLWHSSADPSAAEGTDPRYEIKTSIRRMELARHHLQRFLDLVGEGENRTFITEARIMMAAIEGDLAKEKNAEPLRRVNWDDAARRLSRPADPSRSPYEGPRLPLFVEFERGSSAITHGSTYLLDAVARALSSDLLSNARIMVEGHADSEGDSKANLDLSRKRAQSVRDYFISRGLQPERFLLAAYGELRPIVPNDTPLLRQQNRRIEVVNWDLVQQARQNRGYVAPSETSSSAMTTPTPTPVTPPPTVYTPMPESVAPPPTATPADTTGWEIYQYPAGQ